MRCWIHEMQLDKRGLTSELNQLIMVNHPVYVTLEMLQLSGGGRQNWYQTYIPIACF